MTESYNTPQKIAATFFGLAFASGIVTLVAVLTGKFPPKEKENDHKSRAISTKTNGVSL